jgi:hypothetical protein
MGLPVVPLNTSGLSAKDASMFTKQTRLAAQKALQSDDNMAAIAKAKGNLTDAKRFSDLMSVQDTGFLAGLTPSWADSQISEMRAISDRLTPQQRVPGSGATSDFDAKMFQNAIFGVNKPKSSNQNIVAAIEAANQNELMRQSFMSDFLEVNGHLNGADKHWRQYLDNNPIFDPQSTAENLILNRSRRSYQDYFSDGEPQSPASAGGWTYLGHE